MSIRFTAVKDPHRPRSPRLPWIALLPLSALASCLTIADPDDDLAERQLAPPEQFAAAGHNAPRPHEAVANDWVATFADATLRELVDEAIEHNPDLRQAAAALAEARARTDVAASSLYPQFDGAGAARRAQPLFLAPGAVAPGSQYTVNVEASWEIDLWGRIRSQAAAASAAAEATRLDLAAARQSLAAAVADAWLLTLQAHAALRIDRELLAAEQRTAGVTNDKVETGTGTQLEAQLAAANVALAAAALHADEAAIKELTRALEALLGRYPSAELKLVTELPAFPGATAIGVPSELLARRPDLVAADQRVAAAFHRSQSARAAQLPSLTLTGSVGALLDPTTKLWSIGANLLAPLFTGGRIDAEIEIADAQQEQALAAYVATALQAFREVEDALANEHYLARREAELDTATRRLREASRVGEDRYDAGILSIVDLLTIRRQDFQSRRELLLVHTARLRQRIALHLALGGSFDADDARATPASVAADHDVNETERHD